MPQFYYQTQQWDQQRLLRAMCVVNMAFALLVLAAWQFVGPYVGPPAMTATGGSMSSSHMPGALDYPYVLLWSIPVAATLASWIAHSFRFFKLARYIVCYPFLLVALGYLWHHFARPLGWS